MSRALYARVRVLVDGSTRYEAIFQAKGLHCVKVIRVNYQLEYYPML